MPLANRKLILQAYENMNRHDALAFLKSLACMPVQNKQDLGANKNLKK